MRKCLSLLIFCLLIFCLLCGLWFSTTTAERKTADAGHREIAVSNLPKEAQETLALIRQGGPFPYTRDGIVFGNREKRLPQKPRGYYLEYTVKTPQEKTRGARRIICGGKSPTLPDACYYTSDHYETFSRIVFPVFSKGAK